MLLLKRREFMSGSATGTSASGSCQQLDTFSWLYNVVIVMSIDAGRS